MELRALSNFAWTALDQLIEQGYVHDGDTVCKTGRNELIAHGLAQRSRRCPGCGNMVTELTGKGRELGWIKSITAGSA